MLYIILMHYNTVNRKFDIYEFRKCHLYGLYYRENSRLELAFFVSFFTGAHFNGTRIATVPEVHGPWPTVDLKRANKTSMIFFFNKKFLMIMYFIFFTFQLNVVSFNPSTRVKLQSRHSNIDMGLQLPHKKPRSQNAVGNLFVDESCIDCDVCRWMCPSVFGRKGLKSAVIKQPASEVE